MPSPCCRRASVTARPPPVFRPVTPTSGRPPSYPPLAYRVVLINITPRVPTTHPLPLLLPFYLFLQTFQLFTIKATGYMNVLRAGERVNSQQREKEKEGKRTKDESHGRDHTPSFPIVVFSPATLCARVHAWKQCDVRVGAKPGTRETDRKTLERDPLGSLRGPSPISIFVSSTGNTSRLPRHFFRHRADFLFDRISLNLSLSSRSCIVQLYRLRHNSILPHLSKAIVFSTFVHSPRSWNPRIFCGNRRPRNGFKFRENRRGWSPINPNGQRITWKIYRRPPCSLYTPFFVQYCC